MRKTPGAIEQVGERTASPPRRRLLVGTGTGAGVEGLEHVGWRKGAYAEARGPFIQALLREHGIRP